MTRTEAILHAIAGELKHHQAYIDANDAIRSVRIVLRFDHRGEYVHKIMCTPESERNLFTDHES